MPINLKRASQQLIEEFGGLDAAAAHSRVSRSRLAQCTSPNHEDAYLPIDVVRDLEALLEMPFVTKCLADNKHMTLTSIPTEDEVGNIQIDFIEMTRRFGALMEEYQAALENEGFINAKEAALITKKTAKMQSSLMILNRQLAHIMREAL